MNNEQIHVPRIRTVTGDGFKVELDLSGQVLAVKAPIDKGLARDFDVEPGPAAAPLSATLSPGGSTALVSASVLAQKAKIFDDGGVCGSPIRVTRPFRTSHFITPSLAIVMFELATGRNIVEEGGSCKVQPS